MADESKQDFTVDGRPVKLTELELAAQKAFLRNLLSNAGMYCGGIDTLIVGYVIDYWPLPSKPFEVCSQ